MDSVGRRRNTRWPMIVVWAMATITAACGAGVDAAAQSGIDHDPTSGSSPVSSTVASAVSGDVEADPAPLTPDSSVGPVSGDGIESARAAVVQILLVSGLVTPEGEAQTVSGGTGFIIDESGLAVTNNHVVGGGAAYQVFLDGDDEPRNAQVVALSECADLAVIDIEGDEFPWVEFWDGEPVVSTPVLAAGFPLLDPEFTLTRGIISKQEAGGDSNWASVDAVLEHDARIRGGNSGGPLFTEDGYVIGVNYAGNDVTDQNFAIEAQYAIPIIDQLRAGSPVDSIGLNAEAVFLGEIPGLWVYGVDTGSPADKAGIAGGDFITELENVSIGADGTMSLYCDILRSQGIDQELAVQVFRTGTGEILEGNINADQPIEVVFSPSAAGDPTVQAGGGRYTEFVTLSDDTGLISMQVPAAFTDISTVPLETEYGVLPAIVAAENLSTAVGDTDSAYSGNGALLLAFTDGGRDLVDTLVELAQFDLQNCDLAGDSEVFETGRFEGVIVTLVNCGSARSSIIYVGAQIPGESRFVVLGIQAVDEAMIQAIPTILGSFNFTN